MDRTSAENNVATVQGLAVGVIVAIGLSAFFCICVVPAVGCCVWHRRKKRLARRNQEASEAYARMQAQRATQQPMMAPFAQNQTIPVEIGGTPLQGYYGQPPKDQNGNGYQAYGYGPPPQQQQQQQQTQGVQQLP